MYVGGFVRPYACTICGEAFSRQYTLNVHVKSHEFERYHLYKHEPMLFFDPDRRTMQTEMASRAASREALPPLVEDQLNAIRVLSRSKNSG